MDLQSQTMAGGASLLAPATLDCVVLEGQDWMPPETQGMSKWRGLQ